MLIYKLMSKEKFQCVV